jgi:GntR family transcriptional regulator/MocR family aminotransferase
VRREYRVRRDAIVAALQEYLGDRVTFDVPAGGIALWVKANRGTDVDAWASAAKRKGAIVATAAAFSLDCRSRPFMRLGFAALNVAELREGIRRLAAACPA